MIKKIIFGVVLFLAVFAAVAAVQPDDFRVTRSAEISAPVSTVFEQVNDFHKWQEWSPWARLDPNARATFSGAPAGEGAIFDWSGNDKVGEGRMTLTRSVPGELVRIKLDFVKPMEGSSTAEFTFMPVGDNTDVTWTMFGRNDSFIAKVICLFMDMDKTVGRDFEKGLDNLKLMVEEAAAKK
jgi:uncharacterized protein YndB with AHSA1/START domain